VASIQELERLGATQRPTVPQIARAVHGAATVVLAAIVIVRVAERMEGPSLPLAVASGAAVCGVLALALARFEWAVGLGFVLLPFVRVEPAPADVVLAIVMAVALVTHRVGLRRVPLGIFLLLGAFVLLNLVSTVEAIDPRRALVYFAITVYLIGLAIWLTNFVDSPRRARVVVGSYTLGAVVIAIATLAALSLPLPSLDVLVYAVGEGGERGQGLFKDPNVFGPFLIPPALILLEEAFGEGLMIRRRVVAGSFSLILMIAVVFAYSRATWLSLALGVVTMFVVFALRRGGGDRAFGLLVVLLGAVGLVTAVMVVSSSVNFFHERARFQQYDTSRFGAQASGAELATSHPLGLGPGQFELVSDTSAHSLYVRSLAEQGVTGAAIIVALVLLTLLLAARNAVEGNDTYGIHSAALLGAWVGIAANSGFIDTLHWRHFWVVAALIWIGATSHASTRVGTEVP
jgi:O-antigen ligase